MATSYDKYQKRVISSYFSVILSVFLVLFLLGLLGLFIINSKRLSDNFKEDIVMTVFLKNETTKEDIKAFGDALKTSKFAKDFKYVSKEDAQLNTKKFLAKILFSFWVLIHYKTRMIFT